MEPCGFFVERRSSENHGVHGLFDGRPILFWVLVLVGACQSLCATEFVVFWCINDPFYSLLSGYIKHDLNKYSCFEKVSVGLGPCTRKHTSWLARGDTPSQQLPKPHKREMRDVGQGDYACDSWSNGL